MFLNSNPEKSSTLVEQASQTADEAIKSSRQSANEALDSLANAMQDLRQQAAPALERASGQVSDMAHRGMDSVRETTHQIRVKAEHVSDSTVNYIKNEPVKAILIAAATGAALMALINLISHSRNLR